MKKYFITGLLLVFLPIAVGATLGDRLNNAINDAPEETQDAILAARVTAITKALNNSIAAVEKLNTSFQNNEKYTADDKQAMQDLADEVVKLLNEQIDAIAEATSNSDIDDIRQDTIEKLKTYEDEVKELLAQATTRAYEAMIKEAELVIDTTDKLLPGLEHVNKNVSDLEDQIELCKTDIQASNDAFDQAMDSKASDDVQAAKTAIKTLGKDLTTMVELADELAD